MTKKIFGTDGIRGLANQFPMTSDVALALGRALADKVRTNDDKRNKIVLGKDTRISCYMVEMAFASGVCSRGVDVLMLGPMPTPAVAHLTTDMRADAGVMITASHNPYEDNGIKIFDRDGFKLSDEEQIELEEHVSSYLDDDHGFTKDLIGKAYKVDDARGRYIAHLKSTFPKKLDLSGMRIAVDCANGAAYVVAPKVLEELGADVKIIGNKPNGMNINDGCGAMHPEELRQLAWVNKEYGEPIDIGIALDGDADRLVVVDENGDVVHGDVLLAIASWYIPEKEQVFVTTTMAGMALKEYIETPNDERLDIDVITTDVGDRSVTQAMREHRASVGGEQSGHIIYLEHSTTGDGMVAALKLLSTMRYERKKLSELAKIITPYPQVIVNVPVISKDVPVDNIKPLKDAIDEAYRAMNGKGRVIVRYSGTENKLRVMVEHKDKTTADLMAERIADVARRVIP
jgi:phosphoglucosamine mutase